MVQVINDPYSGNIFGRLGAGIGKGINEELPKVIQRERLASGIERLQDSNLNPVQKTAELIRSGASSDEAARYLPMIQSQKWAQNQQERQRPLERASDLSSFRQNLLQEPSESEIGNYAADLIKQGLFSDRGQALEEAGRVLRGDYQTQQNRFKAIDERINKNMALDLQKSGLGDFQDVEGHIQRELLDLARYKNTVQGKSVEQTAKEISDIIYELGKTATQTKKTGARNYINRNPAEKIQAYRAQKKVFDKYGLGDLFVNEVAAAEDFSREKANSILQPVTDKAIENQLSRAEKASKKLPIVTQKISDGYIDDIIPHIKPNTNLLSLAEELKMRNISIRNFTSKLLKANDEGKIKLDNKQIEQLGEPIGNSKLGDVWWNVFSKSRL